MIRQAFLAVLVVALPLAPLGMGLASQAAQPEAPAETVRVLQFVLPKGSIVREAIPDDATYQVSVDPETQETHVAVYSADGRVHSRSILQIPPESKHMDLRVAQPDLPEAAGAPAGAVAQNHDASGANCLDSDTWCADLDTQREWWWVRSKMWHGIMIQANAPTTTSPSTTYYQMPCNTHVGCIPTTWTGIWHNAGESIGRLSCWRHDPAHNDWNMVVYSEAHMGGRSVTSENAWSTNTYTQSC